MNTKTIGQMDKTKLVPILTSRNINAILTNLMMEADLSTMFFTYISLLLSSSAKYTL